MLAARWSRAQPAQVPGEGGAELDCPAPDSFVGGLDTALRQEFLDIAVAEGEPEIELDRVPDDLSRELVTSIGDGLHARDLPRILPSRRPSCDKAVRPRNTLTAAPNLGIVTRRMDTRVPAPL